MTAINVDAFRNAVQGDAARLEVNSRGTGLNEKGVSNGGRAVEWIRDAAGLRTAENIQVKQTFVQALRTEYGPQIASELEGRLAQHAGGGTPLSARMVKQVLLSAEALRTIQMRNEALAVSFSHAGRQDRLSDYMTTAVNLGRTLGATDEMVGKLFDTNDPQVLQLRQNIGDEIRKLSADVTKPVSPKKAREITEREMRKFLCPQINRQLVDKAFGTCKPEDKLQQELSRLAQELGVPTLAQMLSDPNSQAVASFKSKVFEMLPKDAVADVEFLQKVSQARLQRDVVDEIVRTKQAGLVTGLPRDPEVARDMGEPLISKVVGATDDPRAQTAVAKMIFKEIDRLGAEGPDGATTARALQRALMRSYDKISDPEVKLELLTRERDFHLATARDTGDEGSWFTAAMRQSDIIAFHQQELGQPQTALRSSVLQGLADDSLELKEAMADLDAIGREYVAHKGGDPDLVNLDWNAARDQLAELREAPGKLWDAASGTEVQAFIAAKMRGLTETLMSNAIAVLGPPPSPMAVLSLGSASRGEASPYSDVEFGILLDKPADQAMQEYTRKFSELIRFQVGTLGENAGYEAPAGFHWDTGGNTPLESPTKFIGTADELIRANLSASKDHSGGLEPTEMFGFTMFSNTELLFSPSGGDQEWKLVQDLQKKVDSHFRGQSALQGRTRGQALGPWTMNMGADVARLRHSLTKDVVDVKSISRLPMMLAQGLALAHGLGIDDQGTATNSTAMRLSQLANAGVLSREDADTLADAFSKLGEIRVKAHLHSGHADDDVYLDPNQANGAFAAPELAEVMQSLLPFLGRLEAYLADPSKPF